jgi:hypothetical protein
MYVLKRIYPISCSYAFLQIVVVFCSPGVYKVSRNDLGIAVWSLGRAQVSVDLSIGYENRGTAPTEAFPKL